MAKNEDDHSSKRGLTKFEDRLIGWETNDDDTADTIHAHFTAMEDRFQDWGDVADEGRRLWSMMFEETIESDSPLGDVLSGIAASGFALAIRQVAARLGVSPTSVMVGLESDGDADAQAFVRDCLDNEKAEKDQG